MQPAIAFHNQLIRPCIAELLASIVFSFLSAFSAKTPLEKLEFSIVNGLSLLAAQEIVQRISGSHLNPAVSLAHLIHNRLSAIQCFSYVCVQIFGCFIGAAAHFLLVSSIVFEDSYLPHEIMTDHGQGKLSKLQGFILEALLVTIFCTVHLRHETEEFEQPLIVPSVWALILYISAPLIGLSCNAALSLGSTTVHSIFLARVPAPSVFYLPLLATVLGAFISSLITYSCREVSSGSTPCDPSL